MIGWPSYRTPLVKVVEVKLIPIAALNALIKLKFCVIIIIVSSMMLVIKPLIIANIIMVIAGKGIWVSWKNNIVPKSPIEQPSTHQAVFFALLFQVSLLDQLKTFRDRGSGFVISRIRYVKIFFIYLKLYL